MKQSKALMRLEAIGEMPIYKKNGNLIFRQRFPNAPLFISIIALAIALLK